MADLSITPSNVVPHSIDNIKPVIARYIAEELISQGQLVAILDDGTAGLHDTSTQQYENARGIALNSASGGQPIDIIEAGYLDLGTASTTGEVIVASHTSNGGLAPHSDLVSTNPVVIVGFMYSASILKVDIDNLGVDKA